LAQIWIEYREDEEFKDFIEYNDMGLPLAYFLSENIASPGPLTEPYILETFELLLAALGLDDTGFENLDELFNLSDR
jgi:hypothetical protein